MVESIKSKWNPEEYKERFSYVFEYGEDLLELLDAKPYERILDLGSGTGQLTAAISKSAAEVIGMDKSAEMVQQAKSQYPHLKFLHKDATDFSFDTPFDAIFSNATLHWILDYNSCIKAMSESLKEGGRLVLEFGAHGNIENIMAALRKTLTEHQYHEHAQLKLWFFPTIGEYTSALDKFGIRVLSAWHFDRPTVLKGDLIEWFNMFANPFFGDIPESEAETIKIKASQLARPSCYRDGRWIADYSRIRILARRES